MYDILGLIRPWAAVAAIAMTVPTTWIYFVKIRRGETKPHVLTWTVLPSITLSSAILQLFGGASWGMTPLLFAAVTGYMFAFMAWRRGYMGVITRIDYACIALSVAAWIVWLAAEQAVLAVVALSIASVMAFVPTFRKSWNRPHDEPTSKYALSVLRYGFASIAVVNYSFVTGFYPTLWIGVNAGMATLLVTRRRVIAGRVVESVPAVVDVPAVEQPAPQGFDLGSVDFMSDPEGQLFDELNDPFMGDRTLVSSIVQNPSAKYGRLAVIRVMMMMQDFPFEVVHRQADGDQPEALIASRLSKLAAAS